MLLPSSLTVLEFVAVVLPYGNFVILSVITSNLDLYFLTQQNCLYQLPVRSGSKKFKDHESKIIFNSKGPTNFSKLTCYFATQELHLSPSFKEGSYFWHLLTTNLIIQYLKRLPMRSFADAPFPVIGLFSVNLYEIYNW